MFPTALATGRRLRSRCISSEPANPFLLSGGCYCLLRRASLFLPAEADCIAIPPQRRIPLHADTQRDQVRCTHVAHAARAYAQGYDALLADITHPASSEKHPEL